jgi:DNA polymerase III epsilon subunit-like protein
MNEPAHRHRLISLDTETTGTDPARHEVWELAAVIREPDGTEVEYARLLTLSNLDDADPKALEVGDFMHRYDEERAVSPTEAIAGLLPLTEGGVLGGLNISFDVGFVRPLLGTRQPNWHYSPIDVKSLAAGALGLEPPWSSNDLAGRLGVDPEDFARHSALADCRFALAIYDAALAHVRGRRDYR